MMNFDSFKDSEARWSGTPLIFANQHPNIREYDRDPVSELARIGGRLVGAVSDPLAVQQGLPRLQSNLDVVDPEVNALIDDGKISLSTGFRAKPLGTDGIQKISPHHVLLFRETDEPGGLPRDLATGILNSTGDVPAVFDSVSLDPQIEVLNMTETTEAGSPGAIDKVLEAISGIKDLLVKSHEEAPVSPDLALANKETDLNMTETDANIESLNKQVTDQSAEIEVLNKSLDASKDVIVSLNKQVADLQAFKDDADWLVVKNKYEIPAGMLDGDKEADLRKLKSEDPDAFYNKILDAKLAEKKQSEEGDEFVNKPKAPARGYGKFDFNTRKFAEVE